MVGGDHGKGLHLFGITCTGTENLDGFILALGAEPTVVSGLLPLPQSLALVWGRGEFFLVENEIAG